jgi:hypothetical protein
MSVSRQKDILDHGLVVDDSLAELAAAALVVEFVIDIGRACF